jgi:hypothetical protein
MSRLSTGNAATSNNNSDPQNAEVIARIRVSLGGIGEVAALYGTPEDTKYQEVQLDSGIKVPSYSSPSFDESQEAENEQAGSVNSAKDAYSFSVGNQTELPVRLAYNRVAQNDESKEDQSSEFYQSDLKLSVKYSAEAPRNVNPNESHEAEGEGALYSESPSFSSEAEVRARLASQQAPIARDALPKYEMERREADLRLAKLAGFLPDKARENLNKKFDDAVKLAKPATNEAYAAAATALTHLQNLLDAMAPELRTHENKFLRKQIKGTLDREGGALPKDDKQGFIDRFAALDTDLPAVEVEAKSQLDSLQTLAGDIDAALQDRIKAISDLCADFERLVPIVNRALSIDSDKQADLKKASDEIKTGFDDTFVKEGLTINAIQDRIANLDSLVREVFKNFTLEEAKEAQKNSLPASPDSLKIKGAPLGSGAFGSVYELQNNGQSKLVGKLPSANNSDAQQEMEHEAEIYARIGEHPNIAKCYGIHDVDGKSMLVMDKIEGDNAEQVFNKLNERYRSKKLTREQYLAATQQILKGTLMGLAHMETLGLVHKDIKSDNIKFDTRTNQAVLIDMGLAQPEGEQLIAKAYTPTAPEAISSSRLYGIHSRSARCFLKKWSEVQTASSIFCSWVLKIP